jgi:hypothetical protein
VSVRNFALWRSEVRIPGPLAQVWFFKIKSNFYLRILVALLHVHAPS